MKKKELGFTTIELMIAISISFVMISFIYSVYFFSIKISKSWKEKVNLENTALICMNRLTDDIINASEIQNMSDNQIILELNNDKIVNYKMQNNNIFRNGILLNSHDIKIYDLSLTFLGDTNKTDKLINLTLINNKEISKNGLIQVELISGSNKKRLKLKSAVHPRNLHKAVFKKL